MDQILDKIDAVLFDLDGTLIDTAPDMIAVLTKLQVAHGLDPLPYETARAHISNGALALIRVAFPDAVKSEASKLHREYLERYEDSMFVESKIFPNLPELLDDLDEQNCPWGIVTNKPKRMTDPLLAALGLTNRLSCAISGDTLPQRKPDPAPLLLGCQQTGTVPNRTVYVGDSARDIKAGRAAEMITIAAAFGYIVPGDDPVAWNSDAIALNTKELAKIILKAVNLET
jgi:2-phosphoglycolate phosphatase